MLDINNFIGALINFNLISAKKTLKKCFLECLSSIFIEILKKIKGKKDHIYAYFSSHNILRHKFS